MKPKKKPLPKVLIKPFIKEKASKIPMPKPSEGLKRRPR